MFVSVGLGSQNWVFVSDRVKFGIPDVFVLQICTETWAGPTGTSLGSRMQMPTNNKFELLNWVEICVRVTYISSHATPSYFMENHCKIMYQSKENTKTINSLSYCFVWHAGSGFCPSGGHTQRRSTNYSYNNQLYISMTYRIIKTRCI